MKINLLELNYKDKIFIDGNFTFNANYFENSPIKDLKNVYANGFIKLNAIEKYEANIFVKGTMVILDSVTNEKVDYDFEFEVDDEIEENGVINQNMLDIIELLWQNIVLEVPIRFTKSDAENLSGDNWKVIDGNNKEIDPRMQKLYELNKGGE